jgi:hypothetical protein
MSATLGRAGARVARTMSKVWRGRQTLRVLLSEAPDEERDAKVVYIAERES